MQALLGIERPRLCCEIEIAEPLASVKLVLRYGGIKARLLGFVTDCQVRCVKHPDSWELVGLYHQNFKMVFARRRNNISVGVSLVASLPEPNQNILSKEQVGFMLAHMAHKLPQSKEAITELATALDIAQCVAAHTQRLQLSQ